MSTSADDVWAALAVGAVPSVGLLAGAIAGAFSRIPHQPIAMAMSVGAGLLLAGVSLKVAADAIRIAGPMAAALSLLLGAAVFSASNALLARFRRNATQRDHHDGHLPPHACLAQQSVVRAGFTCGRERLCAWICGDALPCADMLDVNTGKREP